MTRGGHTMNPRNFTFAPLTCTTGDDHIVDETSCGTAEPQG